MGTIQEDGFLSEQIGAWIDKHRSENRDWFNLCSILNAVAQKLMLSIEPSKEDGQQFFVALLFSRILSHFQGIILLTERGMVAEARSLLRGMLDATFSEVALSKHSDLVERFANDDLFQQLKFTNILISSPKNIRKKKRLNKKKLHKRAKSIQEEIDKEGIKPLTSEYLAQRAEMQEYYNTLFALLSCSIHNRVRDLEQYLEDKPLEDLQTLMWGPDVSGISEILMPACDCLFVAARAITVLFKFAEMHDAFQTNWITFTKMTGTQV